MSKLPEYKQHPIAIALMPGGMDDKEFEAFEADCVDKGIHMPITLYEGMVLDGWHRYRVSRKNEMHVEERKYDGKDPAGYIASVNVHRRKLSSLQRALVGARLHRNHGMTQRDACKKLAISNEVITLVLKAMDSKVATIIKRIETDSDYSRNLLKEELADAGLLRDKPKEPVRPPTGGPASVFNPAHISNAAASVVSDDYELLETGVGKGLEKGKKDARKPKVNAANELKDQFVELMEDEKMSFLRMVYTLDTARFLKVLDGEKKAPAAKKAAPKKPEPAPKILRRGRVVS